MKAQTMELTAKVVIAGLVACLASVASAQSKRVPIDPKSPLARPIGQVSQVGSGRTGDGFIMGDDGCFVVTNFHVAFADPYSDGLLKETKLGHVVNFSYDLNASTGKFEKTVAATVVKLGNYNRKSVRGMQNDLVTLQLSSCAGSHFSTMKYRPESKGSEVSSDALATVSTNVMPDGKVEIVKEEGCLSTEEPAAGILATNCQGVPGMSGSMLLRRESSDRWLLAGVNMMILEGGPIQRTFALSVTSHYFNKTVGSVIGNSPIVTASSLAVDAERAPQSDVVAEAPTAAPARVIVR